MSYILERWSASGEQSTIKVSGMANYANHTTTYTVDTSFFVAIDTPSKAYWLGVLVADGHLVTHPKLRLQLQVAEKDADWLRSFLHDMKSDHPVKNCQGGFGHAAVRVEITNKTLLEPLAKYGIKDQRVIDKVPDKLCCHFIRGLVDGDGCFVHETYKARANGYVPHQTRLSLINENRELLLRVQDILVDKCRVGRTKLQQAKGAYVLRIGGNRQCLKVVQYLYPVGDYPYLPRKYNAIMACPIGLRYKPHALCSSVVV